jgi:hypothetical protein
VHNRGTHFIIGRTIGEVFNPVVGGPDRVVNLESSVGTKYYALLTTLEKRFARGQELRLAYALSRARNYSNDDQIPFGNGPLDSNDLAREYGPTPNEQRHRLTLSGSFLLPGGVRLSPIWTMASGVPMDILMPDASTRVPTLARNAGGRRFHNAAELNTYITGLNAAGGIRGVPLPLVSPDARFNDGFNALDLRVSKSFALARACGSRPSSSASTCSTRPTSSARRSPTTRASRTCWRGRARTRATPASCGPPRSASP